MSKLDPQILAQVCPEIQAILDAELSAGNWIVHTSQGWPYEKTVMVYLEQMFLTKPDCLPTSMYAIGYDWQFFKGGYNCTIHDCYIVVSS